VGEEGYDYGWGEGSWWQWGIKAEMGKFGLVVDGVIQEKRWNGDVNSRD
jgi:hypothetical protein